MIVLCQQEVARGLRSRSKHSIFFCRLLPRDGPDAVQWSIGFGIQTAHHAAAHLTSLRIQLVRICCSSLPVRHTRCEATGRESYQFYILQFGVACLRNDKAYLCTVFGENSTVGTPDTQNSISHIRCVQRFLVNKHKYACRCGLQTVVTEKVYIFATVTLLLLLFCFFRWHIAFVQSQLFCDILVRH